MYDKSPSGVNGVRILLHHPCPKQLRPSFRSSPFLSAVGGQSFQCHRSPSILPGIFPQHSAILQKGSRHTSHRYATSNALSQYVVLLFGMFLAKEITI